MVDIIKRVAIEHIRSVCGMLKGCGQGSMVEELLKERAWEYEREEAKLSRYAKS